MARPQRVPAAVLHADWLSLVQVSGPFLSVPVLSAAMPDGPQPPPDSTLPAQLRQMREGLDADPGLRYVFIEWVLRELLGYKDLVVSDEPACAAHQHLVVEHGVILRPDRVINDPAGGDKPLILVQITQPDQDPDRPIRLGGWTASPIERAASLARATGVPLAIVTDGERWTLVWAETGEATGACTWLAQILEEERTALNAFVSVASRRRVAGMGDDALLPLLKRSKEQQQELTDQLGLQVRHAVEMLVDALDEAQRRTSGADDEPIPAHELYRAAVTVVMRLMVLFVAEERKLLPIDDPQYAETYAASSLRAQLEQRSSRLGEEVLDRSAQAWFRALALFRAVHGGLEHGAIRLPAYGGELFDPDRFPFLEGRPAGSHWRSASGVPLEVNDRTMLHLLSALQTLAQQGRAGAKAARVRVSFRGLDVEQIGYVYEGLLDHDGHRDHEVVIGLAGKLEPELRLSDLEAARADGDETLAKLLKEESGLSAARISKALAEPANPERATRLLVSCNNDAELRDRVLPHLALLRDDLRGYPRVFLPQHAYVTKSSQRRDSGTYYTPRSLAEEVVENALAPIAYEPGPAQTGVRADWKLKTPDQLLDLRVCDIAMGSGAFLVAAARYLSQRLIDAWDALQRELPDHADFTTHGREGTGSPSDPRVPSDPLEREQLALRMVVERCIYGVDINPMAVEMAKLSLWLVTLSKDRPFSFLDHALRAGDSLLGVTDLRQLEHLRLDPSAKASIDNAFISTNDAILEAKTLRESLESFVVRDVRDAERKRELFEQAEHVTAQLSLVGDLITGAGLLDKKEAGTGRELVVNELRALFPGMGSSAFAGESTATKDEAEQRVRAMARRWLALDLPEGNAPRDPLHWPLAFPEINARGGFDAVVGNPPFQGGQKLTGALGTAYREYLVRQVAGGKKGSTDLVAYMALRAGSIARPGATIGIVATNTLAQGDTREVGLDQLVEAGWVVGQAVQSMPWPAAGANLEIANVTLRRGEWGGTKRLGGVVVGGITPSLAMQGRVSGNPYRLDANAKVAFQGTVVLGMGFILEPSEAAALIEADPRSAEVIRPYLIGEDLNQRPDASPSRFVIDFGTRPVEEAAEYEACFERVEQLVKPERARNADRRRRELWWQFTRPTVELYRRLARLDRCVAITLVSKVVQPVLVPTGQVYGHAVAIFASDDLGLFGALSSGVHWWWAVERASTMRNDVRYTPTDCFETLPLPLDVADLRDMGRRLDELRSGSMARRGLGLTPTYNEFHDRTAGGSDAVQLRALHQELDQAVAAAYGWDDLDLGHGFHETRFGTRYTFEPVARQEVLDRLLELNFERYADEVARGLHDTKKGGKPKAKQPASAPPASDMESMF